MKKATIITCLVSLGLVALIQSGIIDSLIFFWLVGAVPGTHYSIPSGVMLLAIAGMLWLLVFRFTAVEIVYACIDKRTTQQRLARKKRMPKRRFGQISTS